MTSTTKWEKEFDEEAKLSDHFCQTCHDWYKKTTQDLLIKQSKEIVEKIEGIKVPVGKKKKVVYWRPYFDALQDVLNLFKVKRRKNEQDKV